MGRFNPISEVEQSDLTQPTDRKEVAPILACINRYALEIFATPIGQNLGANSSLSPAEFGF